MVDVINVMAAIGLLPYLTGLFAAMVAISVFFHFIKRS